MQIMGMGIDFSTGDLLMPSMEEQEFAGLILEALRRNAEEIASLTRISTAGTTFRGEVEREQTVDLGDPRLAGWTFLVNENDPQRHDVIDILRPLAEHRGLAAPQEPLLFHNEPPEEWWDWMLENYSSLEGERPPHYVLLAGGPEQIPFRFQSLLQSPAAVGRVSFDALEDLKTYVDKVIRLEKAPDPTVTRDAVFFAPDAGLSDATYFSCHYMVKPLAEEVQWQLKFGIRLLLGQEATKQQLLNALRGARPALVYTASHGLGAPSEPWEVQRRIQGAICCQRQENQAKEDRLFTAEDVPRDEPFLEGTVFFQFACFGYGTPAESDFMHWLGKPGLNAPRDFIAALPKALLAHPRGPVGFVGHLDTAWLHGFADPQNRHILDRWHPRIEPFVHAVRTLLRVGPTGLAMANMNKKYDIGNALLTGTFDRLRKGKLKLTPDFYTRLTSTFITRSDAQNYMIFGDPAARLRIPT
jgi:hypothetical protein